MDDSQPDVLSEESWQDQVPSLGHEPHDAPDEEVESRVSAVLPAADTLGYIGLPTTGETTEVYVPEGYPEAMARQTVDQKRKFLITGWCNWRGRRIENFVKLARAFDHQIIGEMERTVQEWRKHKTKITRNPDSTENTQIGATTQLQYALHNRGSEHGERLLEIFQQFNWCDFYCDHWNENEQTQSHPKRGTQRDRSANTTRLAVRKIHPNLVGLRWQGQDDRSHHSLFQGAFRLKQHRGVL